MRERCLRATLLGVLVAASTGAHVAAAAEATHAAPAARTDNRLLALGPEGRALSTRAGVWDVTFTSWAKPGATPVSRTGLVAERRMIGPMLEEHLHTTPGSGGGSFARVDDLTFNRLEARWEYMSMDTRVPDGLMTAASADRDPASRISIGFAPFATPLGGASATGQYFRMQELIARGDANHEVKDQYFMPADGAGRKWLAIRYSYTRRS